jgi:YD repeat-containing protein
MERTSQHDERLAPNPAWFGWPRHNSNNGQNTMNARRKAGSTTTRMRMRYIANGASLRRGRHGLLALFGLVGGLIASPAGANSFYETNRNYFFGMGDIRAAGGSVDVPTGAFLIRFPLHSIPGRIGHQLAWFFNSQDGSNGPLGKGTSLSVSYFTQYGNGGGIDLVTPGHRRYRFTYDWYQNAYINTRDPEMLGSRFTQVSGLEGTMRLKSGEILQFDGQGRLTQIKDRHGNYVAVDNGTSFPQAVRWGTSYWPRVNFTYDGSSRLTRIRYEYSSSSPLNRNWDFTYDASSRLSTVTNPMGGVTRYTWSTYTRSDGQVLPLIATVTNPRNFVSLRAEYDTVGRATRLTAADDGVTTLSYSGAIGSSGTTTLTDPLGNVTSWSYVWPTPPAGETAKFGYRLTSITDPLSRTTQYEALQPGSHLITRITDFRGRVTNQTWDYTKGNKLTVTTPSASGGTATTTWTYEIGFSQRTSVTDPLGRQTTATVDSATGNTTQVQNERAALTSFTYDAVTGDKLSVTNHLNETHFSTYDYYGYLTQVTSNGVTRVSYTYDDAKRMISATDANGKTVQYTYDALDRLTSIQRTLNGQPNTTSFEYDANGNRTALVDPKGQRWEWSFDAMDRVVQDKNPLLQIRSYTHDKNGNVLTRTDRKGQTVVSVYGTGDRPISHTFKRADGSTEATVTFSYSPTTHLLESVTDSEYGTTLYGYDSLDRPISVDGPLANDTVVVTLHDKINRREGLQVPGQGAVSYGYSPTDRVTGITQNAQTTSFEFDMIDRPTRRTLPNAVSTEWTYNSLGFLNTLVSKRNGVAFDSRTYYRDNAGILIQETANGQTSLYNYDDLYRLQAANIAGTEYSWTFGAVGNRLSQTVAGVTTTYSHNAANRLTAVNGVTVTHDANGCLTAFGSDAYTWDVRGRLRTLARPGATYQFGYNHEGIRCNFAEL